MSEICPLTGERCIRLEVKKRPWFGKPCAWDGEAFEICPKANERLVDIKEKYLQKKFDKDQNTWVWSSLWTNGKSIVNLSVYDKLVAIIDSGVEKIVKHD